MKKNTPHFLVLYVILTVFGISCSKEFEEHYNPRAKVDKNIIEVLGEDPELSDFVKVVDKVGLRKELGEAAIYTCLAPTNEHVQAFIKANGFGTIDATPEALLRQYVNAHFINGMYYKYDIEKRYNDAAKGGLAPSRATYYTTRGEGNLKAKSIRIFTQPFFLCRQMTIKQSTILMAVDLGLNRPGCMKLNMISTQLMVSFMYLHRHCQTCRQPILQLHQRRECPYLINGWKHM